MTALPPEPSRVPALDGVRGLAIALVMPFHFVSQYAPTQRLSVLGETFRIGWSGVDLFFVLSGFLITGILLDQRGAPRYYAAFYWRRLLRIVPAFVVFMTIVWLMVILMPNLDPAGARHFREWQPWYWTFTVNTLALRIGGAAALPYGTGHLWSLSVEENFYLIWPALLAGLGARWIPRVLWLFVGIAIATRIGFVAADDATNAAHSFTLARIDTLALGGLLAWAWRQPAHRTRLAAILGPLANASGLAWIAVAGAFYGVMRLLDRDGFPYATPMRIVGFTLTAVVGVLLVACALLAEERSALGRFFGQWMPRWLGRYAYSLYLFHVFIALTFKLAGFTVQRLTASLGSLLLAELAFVLVVSAACCGFSALSWKLVEQPMLSLKDRIPYGVPAHVSRLRPDAASRDLPAGA